MAGRYQFDDVSISNLQGPQMNPTEPIPGQGPSGSLASSNMQPKNPLAISSMISPPEQAPLENFRQVPEPFQTFNMQPPSKPKQTNPQQPPSPPISPWTKADNHVNATTSAPGVKDPILFPEAPASPSSPLFSDERKLSPAEVRNAVSEHIAARRVASLPRHVAPPNPQDYEDFLAFTENVFPLYQRNPRIWLRRNREQLREDAKARARRGSGYAKTAQPNIHVKPLMARPSNTIIARATATKHAIPQRNSSKVTKPSTGSRPVRAQTVKAARRISSTPEPRSRLVPPNREDKDFNAIPDFCPPLNSLPDKSNLMRVDWKGAPLDLSKDPHKHLLHPDELQLAAGLRLDCATYLTSKRRIFEARLDYYHKGKEFRKTHAQQACKIDVNKASKLHTAYERAGWLEKRWMQDLPVPMPR